MQLNLLHRNCESTALPGYIHRDHKHMPTISSSTTDQFALIYNLGELMLLSDVFRI